MSIDVGIRCDRKRGCGWRKPGGLYLVSDGLASPCGRLPIPLDVCPTCSHGIKPSRGFTWIDGDAIIGAHPCKPPEGIPCNVHCPLSLRPGRVGLLWIGEVYYPTPDDFRREADRLGVSRRIPDLPRGFIVGRTWVWLAHRKAVPRPCEWCMGAGKCSHCDGRGHTLHPGVFRAFKPHAVEYVTVGNETDEQLQRLVDRDITPVIVQRSESKQSSFDLEPSEN